MTGFRLSWYLQDSYGNNITEMKSDMPANWMPANAKVPRSINPFLTRAVQLASFARLRNISREEIIERTIKEKAEIVQSGYIDYVNMCTDGQISKFSARKKLFGKVTLGLIVDRTDAAITDIDVTTGFMIYSAMVYCPDSNLKLYQFLHSLLSTKSPRTIIKATVSTIESGNIKDNLKRNTLNQFYIALDKVIRFQYGKILLALASFSELENMISMELPYFTNFTQDIDLCLSSANCQGIIDIVQSLGKFSVLLFYFSYLFTVQVQVENPPQ